ncbi:Hsp70 protein [Streptomyces sp. 1114.5]|uniref:Hsp70 family protein n=1 Tax=unclassified Streptomyces TaxID=2593676 RepID=UPI000BC641F7|nr:MULTISPECIES: Hsp70 family protein [unclassified Streptomyces]RKT19064.1 Hsp70 protein [Streptomyces sp. 1114.5]SOB85269.1 Hsp70 protein [Streptomyces sp. 1331.2]
MYRTLGIDLGTTNSVVAHLRRGEPEIIFNRQNQEATPSVVGSGRKGELLVGSTARSRIAIDGANVIRSVKRFMGRKFKDPQVQAALKEVDYKVTAGTDGDVNVWFNGRSYTPIEISAIILHRLKEDAEQRFGEPFHRAVITVPAYFGERQVAATQEAGRMAGLHVLRIINEPTAAALAYGITSEAGDEGRTVLVYDLGGGTFDISILLLVPGSVSVLGIEGDNLLGGDDFDRAITTALLEDIREEYGSDYQPDLRDRPKIASTAETIKIELSNQEASEVILPGLGAGQLVLETEFERARFEDLIEARIERTIELTHKAIMQANLTVGDIDEVVLVGGSTAIPLVARRLGEVFGPRRIRRGVNPMQCVALGAAVQSALVGEVECPECRAPGDLSASNCANCATTLLGGDRVPCPTCHIPVDSEAADCPKCGQSMDGSGGSGPTVPKQAQATTVVRSDNCPRCGTPAAPGVTACELCGEPLNSAAPGGTRVSSTAAEDVGLRCGSCAVVNPPGTEVCTGCGELMQVTNPFDITPKNLGIELNDGRLAVIIPKNTSYPTSSPVSREFVVSGSGRQRLEIAVYEGEHEIAQQNELIGHLTLRLPEGLGGRTPVEVSFGLDRDRTITLSVRIQGGAEKTVKLERVTLDPELKVQVEEQQRQIESFTDRWGGELTEAEMREAQRLMDTLDDLAAGQTRGRSVDEALERAQLQLKAQRWVRGSEAYLSLFIHYCEKHLDPSDLDRLRSVSAELRLRREAADWEGAMRAAQRADELCDSLGHTMRMLTMCNVYVTQNMVSPALAQLIMAELRGLDAAVEAPNMEEVNRHMSNLLALYAQAQRELGSEPTAESLGPVRPEEAGPR